MQFGNAEIAWLLLLVPLGYLLVHRQERRRSAMLARFGDTQLLSKQLRGPGLGKDKWLLALVTLFLALTVLRPQWGFVWREGSRSGVDIVIALDVSESMMATDVLPNRLVRAKREVQDLLQTLKGDRVALVSFAGTAYVESPLTLDYGAFRVFLSSLKPELIPIPGTNLEGAIVEGIKTFIRGAPGKKQAKGGGRDRALILITDGEDFEGDFAYAAALAREEGVKIYVFGIGTPDGSPIPTPSGYKRDKEGSIVISRLNEGALQELAAKTGGIYVRSISSARDTSAIYDLGIRKTLEAREFEYGRSKRYNEYYQFPLGVALVLLVFGLWNGRTRFGKSADSAAPQADSAAGSKTAASSLRVLIPLLFFLAPQHAEAQSSEELGLAAKQAYDEGQYEAAQQKFSEAALLNNKDPRLKLGEGASFYRLQDFERATAAFMEAATLAEESDRLKAHALFNAGNAMVQLDRLQEAINAYSSALKITPEDSEIEDNLEYAKILLRQKQESPDGKDGKDKNREQKDQQDQADNRQEPQEGGEADKEKNQGQDQQQPQEQQQDQGQDQQQQQDSGDQEQSQQEQNSGDESSSEQESGPGQQEEKDRQGGSGSENQQPQDGEDGGQGNGQKPEEDSSKSGDKESNGREGDREDRESQKEQGAGAQLSPSPEGSEKDNQSTGGSGSPQQPQEAPGTGSSEQRFEQGEAMLNTIDEKVGERMKYRLREGMRQLQEQEKRIPEKDW